MEDHEKVAGYRSNIAHRWIRYLMNDDEDDNPILEKVTKVAVLDLVHDEATRHYCRRCYHCRRRRQEDLGLVNVASSQR